MGDQVIFLSLLTREGLKKRTRLTVALVYFGLIFLLPLLLGMLSIIYPSPLINFVLAVAKLFCCFIIS